MRSRARGELSSMQCITYCRHRCAHIPRDPAQGRGPQAGAEVCPRRGHGAHLHHHGHWPSGRLSNLNTYFDF